MNPLKTIQRSLADGYEYVSIDFTGPWYRSLCYQSDATGQEKNKEYLKMYLAVECGYPEEEWWRILEIVPSETHHDDEYGVNLIVKFANPGKCFEEMLRLAASRPSGAKGFNIDYQDDGTLVIYEPDGPQRLKISPDALNWSGFDKQVEEAKVG